MEDSFNHIQTLMIKAFEAAAYTIPELSEYRGHNRYFSVDACNDTIRFGIYRGFNSVDLVQADYSECHYNFRLSYGSAAQRVTSDQVINNSAAVTEGLRHIIEFKVRQMFDIS